MERRNFKNLRWSIFKNFATAEMYAVVAEQVFPFCAASGAMAPPTRNT